MTFFSTASRSPKAGTAAQGFRDFVTNLEILEQKQTAATAKAQEANRVKTLSKSLLGLEDTSQQSMTNWAIKNEVSASELKALEPIVKQKKDKKIWADKSDRTSSWQENTVTGEKKNLKDKPLAFLDKEDPNFTWQEDPVTGKKTNIKERPVKYLNKEDNLAYWQEDPLTGQKSNIKYKADIEGKDRVAPWYEKLKAEVGKAYYGDNLEPTDTQRNNYDRAMLRAEGLINTKSIELGISKEQALPLAMQDIRRSSLMSKEITNMLPQYNPGITNFSSSKDESIIAVQQMARTGYPIHLIGEALMEKGWNDEETAEILGTATALVSPTDAGIDMIKLRKNMPKPGQSVMIKGKLWTRQGDYLIGEDGKKVKI